MVEGVRATELSQFRGRTQALIVPTRSVLWHKERLLNLGIEWLPDKYDAVVWADADLLWQCNDLKDRIEQALETWPVIQPWSSCKFLRQGNNPATGRVLRTSMGKFNAVNGTANAQPRLSHPGFAWAIRRDLFVSMSGLYAHQISGNGDTIVAAGMYGDLTMSLLNADRMNAAMLRHWQEWATGAAAAVQGRIGYVDVEIHHLYHGELHDRQYADRWANLVRNGYDPFTHIVARPGEALRWSPLAPHALRQSVASYLLEARKEDGPGGGGRIHGR